MYVDDEDGTGYLRYTYDKAGTVVLLIMLENQKRLVY